MSMLSLYSLQFHCSLQEHLGDTVASRYMFIPQHLLYFLQSWLELCPGMSLHGCRAGKKSAVRFNNTYSVSNELIGILCVFDRCPPVVLVAASKLSALTMVISARTLRLPRLIFIPVLAIVNTRVDNVGPSSTGEVTCGVTWRRNIITGDLRVRSVRARMPRNMDWMITSIWYMRKCRDFGVTPAENVWWFVLVTLTISPLTPESSDMCARYANCTLPTRVPWRTTFCVFTRTRLLNIMCDDTRLFIVDQSVTSIHM